MNKLLTLISIAFLTLQMTSCKSDIKKESLTTTEEKNDVLFSVQNADNKINFTAYKTTDKVPVKGMFTKLSVTKGGEANTIFDAMNGVEFTIPVSSIETNDSSRNFKIQKFFFGIMENTVNLSGKLILEKGTPSGFAEFTMNNVTKKLPFTYTIKNSVFNMTTVINVEQWNGQSAIASLNEACKDLHKGADGISKTWSEVAITIVSSFQ